MALTAYDIPTADLKAELAGELITPNDLGYDKARRVYLEGVDRHPVAVARVAGAGDVARVIRFAREGNVELAVRSGGHSFAGHGASEGGIVIDLSRMTALAIDAASRTAWVETGMTAGEYTAIAGEQPPGWATRALSGSGGSPSRAGSGFSFAAAA